MDGNGIPFYFDHVNKKLLVDVTLKDGVNEIEIQASNSAGSTNNRTEIIKKGTIPVIKLRKSGSFSTEKRPIYTTTPTVFIDGYANHLDKNTVFEYSTSPSDLGNLKFNSSSGTIVGKVGLLPNEIVSVELKISNSYGSATKNIHFFYEYFDEEPELAPVIQQKTFEFNNSNKTNQSSDTKVEEVENNTYSRPINITKGNNKEKEDTNTYKEEGKKNNSSVPPRSGIRSTSSDKKKKPTLNHQAEEQLKAAEAVRKAEEQRKAAEAAKKAEAVRKAEEQRKAAEAAKKAEVARKRKNSEKQRKLQRKRKLLGKRKNSEKQRKLQRKRKPLGKAEEQRKAAEAAKAGRRKNSEKQRKLPRKRKNSEKQRKLERRLGKNSEKQRKLQRKRKLRKRKNSEKQRKLKSGSCKEERKNSEKQLR